ncbi:MAG: asparagine synthase (glutamine-hydrolyzing) [Gammaproteobacteria bacterium]
MCGIAGVSARLSPPAIEELLVQMSASIRHRGPDADGIWMAPDGTSGFAHRRLSIIDLSTVANQPMTSASGRYVLTFNGEIYNFQTLRSELQTAGYAFKTRSDTEVILAGIEIWGLQQSLERFIGMFAFAVWDRNTKAVYLVRDRLGVKPLYYGFNGGQWAFASELKALESVDFLDFSLSATASSLYLRYGYIPAPHSIYRGIQKVPPGSIVCFATDGRQPSITRYWDLISIAEQGQKTPAAIQPDEAVERLEELLNDAVRLRMIADVPLGAFLSGGIDSSTIVAMMRRHSSRKIRTFTIGFHEPSMDEAPYARAVAEHLGTEHHELYIGQAELLQHVDEITTIADEPFADASILPTWLLSRLAASEVKVVLSRWRRRVVCRIFPL